RPRHRRDPRLRARPRRPQAQDVGRGRDREAAGQPEVHELLSEALFNPFLPEFHADPYPFYHRLRSVEPVHQTPMGFWVLTRYDDVVMALRDPRFGRDAKSHDDVVVSREHPEAH